MSHIAKDLGITHNTVRGIIEESDIDKLMANHAAQSVSLIPKALKVMHDRLDKGSENAAIVTLKETIWPLNSKAGRGMKPGDNLFLSIQNLIQPQTVRPLESAIECVPQDTQAKPTK